MTNMTKALPLVLASSSKARKALLARLCLPFTTDHPDIDETPHQHENAQALVIRLAIEKAQAVQMRQHECLIIACDQVGIIDHHMLTKPLTHANALQQLQLMSENTIRFYTSLCVLNTVTSQLLSTVEIFDGSFRKLTTEMINHYLAKEKPYHCAGSFQIEGLGISLVHALSGNDYTALIGLPLIKLNEMLETFHAGPLQV